MAVEQLQPPEIEAAVPLIEIMLYAALNPATIFAAFWLGRQANEKAKILIAAFAGAVAGIALLFLAALLRVWDAPTLGRAGAGVFVASLLAGLVYARVGYAFRRQD
ncbi:MAG: hypothetical protein ACT4OU_10375 [Hyphomicrobium sp.]